MKVASSESSSFAISFQVYYGQTPLHVKNDWELVFRESQLQALERQSMFTLEIWLAVLQVEVLEGQLQREYPLRLAVSTSSGSGREL